MISREVSGGGCCNYNDVTLSTLEPSSRFWATGYLMWSRKARDPIVGLVETSFTLFILVVERHVLGHLTVLASPIW